MKNQVIVSIGREYGSGGHEIADMLSKRLSLALYDSNILRKVAVENNVNARNLIKYDEMPKSRLFSRRVMGLSNSPEENVAQLQFDYLRGRAKAGESFVVVGRCAETVLKDQKCLITAFITGDMDKKIKRIAEKQDLSYDEAEELIYTCDKKRKTYHNYYSEGKWGDSRFYDLCINSSRLGITGTEEILERYIKRRIAIME